MKKLILCAAIAASTIGLAYAGDAPAGIRRVELQRSTIPGSTYVTLVMRAEIDAGNTLDWHTHPGDEIGYVLQGQLTLSVQGQADRTIKPGETFIVKAGTPHKAHNGGKETYLAVGSYVVDSTKPLATPAKPPQ